MLPSSAEEQGYRFTLLINAIDSQERHLAPRVNAAFSQQASPLKAPL